VRRSALAIDFVAVSGERRCQALTNRDDSRPWAHSESRYQPRRWAEHRLRRIRIECSRQTRLNGGPRTAAAMDARCGVRVGMRAGRVGTQVPTAAIRVADQRAPLRINRLVHEVEQVAVVRGVSARRRAQITDRATLDRIVRRRVNRSPGQAPIESGGDIEMPGRILRIGSKTGVVAGNRRAKNAYAARLSSPATNSGKVELTIPKAVPTSWSLTQVSP